MTENQVDVARELAKYLFAGGTVICDEASTAKRITGWLVRAGQLQGQAEVERLRAENEQLRREYSELAAAVWACRVDELREETTHTETVDEAVRDTLRAVAAEAKAEQLQIEVKQLRAENEQLADAVWDRCW